MFLHGEHDDVTLSEEDPHHDVKLNKEDLGKLIVWVDTNCHFRGLKRYHRDQRSGRRLVCLLAEPAETEIGALRESFIQTG